MRGWLDILWRLAAGAAATIVLWWIGGRLFGVSTAPVDLWAAVSTACWVVVIGVMWALILGTAIGSRLGELAGRLWLPSDSSFRVRPEYSIAEARVKQGRYEEAIEAFRRDIEKFPKEVTPHMRIAEILIEHLHDPVNAVVELKAALPKARDVETFALVTHRLADIYAQQLGDSAAAVDCLNEIQRRFPKSRRARAALERAERLGHG
jgi:tetratricopeptide (TPR) repeat protein